MGAAQDNPYVGKMRLGDVFAPFYSARFLVLREVVRKVVQADGSAKEEPDGRVVVTEPQDEQVEILLRNYVTSISIKMMGSAATFCEVILQPPFEDALRIIDNQLLDKTTLVAVSWGWISNNQDAISSREHVFRITQPKLSMSGMDATITLSGTDIWLGAAETTTNRPWSRITYATDIHIINELVAPYKLLVSVALTEPTSLIRQAKTSPSDPPVIEQNESDWTFLARLCDMNNATFFVHGNVMEIIDKNVSRTKKPFCRFVFFNQPQKADDVPMFGYSVNANANLFFPPASKEVVVHYHDPNTGDQQTVIDPSQMPDQRFLGERTAAGPGTMDGRTLRISDTVEVIPRPLLHLDNPSGGHGGRRTGSRFSVPAQGTNRDEHAKLVARDAILIANTDMECSIPGVPGLVPMQNVQVDGVPKVFSGLYFVKQIVHKLDTSGYECDVSLFRDTSTGDKTEGSGTKPATGGITQTQPDDGDFGDEVDPFKAEDPDHGPSRSF